MDFSLTWYSYGAGLVMAGWLFGMAVNVVFSALRAR